MNSPLTSHPNGSDERATRAKFWHDGKWQWIVDAVVFGALGLTCIWPILSAGDAVIRVYLLLGG